MKGVEVWAALCIILCLIMIPGFSSKALFCLISKVLVSADTLRFIADTSFFLTKAFRLTLRVADLDSESFLLFELYLLSALLASLILVFFVIETIFISS